MAVCPLTRSPPLLPHPLVLSLPIWSPGLGQVLSFSWGSLPFSPPGCPLPSSSEEPWLFLFPSPSSELPLLPHLAGPCRTQECWDLQAHYLASGNTSVAPCTDFFSFACGGAKGTYSSFQALAEENKRRLQKILGEAPWVDDSPCKCVALSLELSCCPKPM